MLWGPPEAVPRPAAAWRPSLCLLLCRLVLSRAGCWAAYSPPRSRTCAEPSPWPLLPCAQGSQDAESSLALVPISLYQLLAPVCGHLVPCPLQHLLCCCPYRSPQISPMSPQTLCSDAPASAMPLGAEATAVPEPGQAHMGALLHYSSDLSPVSFSCPPSLFMVSLKGQGQCLCT